MVNKNVTFTRQKSITLQVDKFKPIAGLFEGQTWNGMTEFKNAIGVVVLSSEESRLSQVLNEALGSDAEPVKGILVSITPALLTASN